MQAELSTCELSEKLEDELEQERLKLTKASHFIEMQLEGRTVKVRRGSGSVGCQVFCPKTLLSELLGDAEGEAS